MASARVFAVSVAVFLAALIRSGEGIRCWVCSSDVDRRCADPFNMTHLAVTDCDRTRAQSPYLQSIAVCKKTKQRINNQVITVRSCWEADDYGTGPCSADSMSSYAKTEYCSTCSHDTCNAALSLTAGLSLPLFAAVLVSRHFATAG